MKTRVTIACALAASLASGSALAQMGRPGGAGGGGGSNAPTQSSPTQNKIVGPRSPGASGDDDDTQVGPHMAPTQRAEPTAAAPADPLLVPPEIASRIGSDMGELVPPPVGETKRSFFPLYEEHRGDYRFRLLPPFYLESTRNVGTAAQDRESLISLLYYQRRSRDVDADIIFPGFWSVRDHDTHLFVLGPLAHRQSPLEHDNWLAPILFEGKRADGGYFHALPILTTSHWSSAGAFTLVGPYFRDRTQTDTDMGVVPFFFHGDNGNVEGARKTYTLVPPLFYYHREREIDSSTITVAGPVVMKSDPKRSTTDVLPFYWHISGHPETGGIHEEHTTLLPFFHYGHTENESLFVVPGYLRRVTPTVDTMVTPFYSNTTTRSGATSTTVAGPIVPLFYHHSDRDTGYASTAVLPFYYTSDSPEEHSYLTPLFGRFDTYGKSRTIWAFPTFIASADTHGWETDLHPILYFGRNEESSHSVVAPIFWDFASPTHRTTVAFPVYWRFADKTDGSVVQVAGNTVYTEKRVAGGTDWQFHVVPFFSYGENPNGYWWNVLFGLTGYERNGSYSRVKAFWIPIQTGGPSASPPARAAAYNQ